MSSTHLSEDVVRTLSRLVFACITPGTATLKLFDPATGALGDYLLVKVMPEPGPRFGRRPRQAKAHSPPLPILNDLVERLKAAASEDSSSDRADKKLPPLLPPRLMRRTPHAQLSRTTAVALFDSSRSDESYASPFGPLAQLKRALSYGSNSDSQGSFRGLSTSPLASSSGASSSLLADSHPSDADSSSLTFDNPASLRVPSPSFPPPLHRDCKPSDSENTSGNADFSPICPSAPRLVGLGFSNMLKDDGTPFDGHGILPDDHHSCMSSVSPSDEARARAAERRGLRGPQVDASPESPLVRPPTPKVVRFSAVSQDRDEEFGFTAKTSTPVKATPLLPRHTPAAPPRRVIGKLPMSLEKRPARRQSFPKVGPVATTPKIPQLGGVAARRDSRRSSKRSPVLAGTPPGEQLRLWSNWMTPVDEKVGDRRPSWRP